MVDGRWCTILSTGVMIFRRWHRRASFARGRSVASLRWELHLAEWAVIIPAW